MAALKAKVGERGTGRTPPPGSKSLPTIAKETGLSVEKVGRCLSGGPVTLETVLQLSNVYGILSPVWKVETEEEAKEFAAAAYRLEQQKRMNDLKPTKK